MPFSSSFLHKLIKNSQSLFQTQQLHAISAVLDLVATSPLISSSLLISYSSFNSPFSSLLFSSIPSHSLNSFLYNTLIRSLSIANQPLNALLTYNSMLKSSPIRPDDRTYPFALKACADSKSLRKGRELHGSIQKLGFATDVFVGNTLLSLYGSCNELGDARKVFDEMGEKDVVSWNSVISVSLLNGLFDESMGWFVKLRREELGVNEVSLVSVLPACGGVKRKEFGMAVHGFAVKVGLDWSVRVVNAIVDMYGKCGDLEALVGVFRRMPERNDVSWNSMIGNLVHGGMFGDAVRVFREMLVDSEVKPNSITVSSLLPALVELGWLDFGKEVHGYSIRNHMDSDVYVGNTLLDMYAKSGCMLKASDIFYRMMSRNVVSWNTMIANLAQNGEHLEAIKLVFDMQANGETPNSVTFTNVLPACARIASLRKGKEIHALSIRDGSYLDLFVSNALIDMYAKCGRLDIAKKVFEVSEKDQVSYNTLIVGFSQATPCLQESLHVFREMGLVGIEYDAVSFMGALSACANLSALKHGKEIHCLTVKKLTNTHLFVANSLLDLYTKCGRLDIGRKIFDRITNKDVASWNAMILGYGMQGELDTAINLFDLMEDGGVKYDHVSYIAVLSACSHGGLVERGKNYFEKMLSQNIKPTQMHYACMVDLLGRAGLMKEAEEFITGMPFEADSNVWGAFLGACRVHRNLEMGKLAAERLFVLKPEHCGYYALLSNMYAEAGKWEEADEVRRLMKSRRAKKNPGYSWVEVGDEMRSFAMGEQVEEADEDFCYVT